MAAPVSSIGIASSNNAAQSATIPWPNKKARLLECELEGCGVLLRIDEIVRRAGGQ